MALNQQGKGFGPITPGRPIQPIRGIESGAPGSNNRTGLRPMSPMGALGGLQAMRPMAPMQQSPYDQEEMALDAIRNAPIESVDTPSAAFDRPPIDTPKTFDGWVKNLSDDISSFIEGIPAMVKMAWTSGKYISKNLDGVKMLYEHPEFLTKELDQLKTDVIKGITDTYKDGFGEALYKHPFTVLMDATTIFDVVGGGLKLAGKAALTTAERQAMKAGVKLADSTATKLLKLGDNIQRTPGRIFAAPIQAVGRGALKIPAVQKFAEMHALTPYGQSRVKRMASIKLERRVVAAEEFMSAIKKDVPKKDWLEFRQLITGYKPIEDASNPMLAEYARGWKRINSVDEEWVKNWGVKAQGELDAAALKPLAEQMFEEGLIPQPWRIEGGKVVFTQEGLDAAKAWTQGANKFGKPTEATYWKYIEDRGGGVLDFLEDLKGESNNLSRVKRFEKKGLAEGTIRNPNVVMARAKMQMADLKGTVDYIADTIQNSGKLVKAGQDAPKGHVFMDPVLVRYIESGLIPGHELLVSRLADEMAKGLKPYDALKNAAKAVDNEMGPALIAAAKEAADNPKNWGIAIPIEDAYLIEAELRGVSGPLRFYDKLMNTWRSVVLRLMPRYYMNNLLGNSILLLSGGHLPWSKTVTEAKVHPAEAISASGLLSEAGYHADFLSHVPGMKQIEKITDKLASATDARPRGLLAETKLREILKEEAEVGNILASQIVAEGVTKEALDALFLARKEEMALAGRQGIAAKKVTLGTKLEGEVKQIDSQMAEIQKRIDTEKALSNAAPPLPSQDVAGLEAAIQAKIAQNAPVVEIRQLQSRLQAAQNSKQAAVASPTKLQELQEQLRKLGTVREQKVGAYPFQGGANAGRDVEELIQLASRREALKPASMLVEKAVTEMERFLGNYGRQHPITREWIRRAIPFWTFAATMNKLLFTMPFVAPKKAFLWNHYAKMMIDGANDDRLPPRFRNHIPIGGTKDGEIIFMRVGGFNPFEAASATEMGGNTIPKLIDPASNPFIKALIETRGGYDTFTEKPFVNATDFVSLDGTVWRYEPKTNVLEPVIPQKPLVAALLNQIPHVKVIQEMLDGFEGTRGIANNTRRDPEGNYLYDRSPLWSASRALGFPITVSDPERVKAQHAMIVRGIQKRFGSAMRRVDPDTQGKLQHILESIGRGDFDLREW
jgi:hypothetical protein